MPLYKVFSIIIFFQFLYGLLHYCFLLHGVYFVRVAFLLKTLQQHFLLEAQSSLRRNILIWNNCIMNIFCFLSQRFFPVFCVTHYPPSPNYEKETKIRECVFFLQGPIITPDLTLQVKI